MELRAFERRGEAEAALAREIAELIRAAARARRRCALGLAAGRSPLGLYAELARLHRAEGLSFSGVDVFQVDEFAGIGPDHPASFRRFLREHFLDLVDLAPDAAHLLDGERPAEEACAAYEAAIRAAGGIDLQVLGLGWNGHVGFNEPGSDAASRTRRVALHAGSRAAAAASLGCEVPAHALTLGLGTLAEARRLRLLAFGAAKAEAVGALMGGAPGAELPAAHLRGHPDAQLLVDAAAGALCRRGSP